jgi:hypothetical protein
MFPDRGWEKPSALRSMLGRRRTSWPRITGKQSRARALIRTRPAIATERDTGPAQIRTRVHITHLRAPSRQRPHGR